MNRGSVGAVVGVAFGCAWAIAGATALRPPWGVWAVRFSIGISAALILALGILLVVWLLKHLSLTQLLLPAIGFVVGLHFVGLWKATDLRLFLWTAGAICTLCVVAAFLPDFSANGGPDVRRVVVGLGCAFVLWAAGAAVLF